MRTTVEFPPALMRAAKARSAERGESLKSLLSRALAVELGRGSGASPSHRRVALPLFGQAVGPRANPSNVDLERALADAEITHVAASGRRSHRRPRLRANRR